MVFVHRLRPLGPSRVSINILLAYPAHQMLSLALLGFDLPQLSIPESDSTGSSIQAKEVDNDSKELKDKIEALNEELVIERQTRDAAEATLEHLRAEYIEADAKSQ
ncbi:hypothetical protein Tco_1563344 [Tanacetum coccineum]